MRMPKMILNLATAFVAFGALAVHAEYIIVLTNGTTIRTTAAPRVEEGRYYFQTTGGVQGMVPANQVDKGKTTMANLPKAAPEPRPTTATKSRTFTDDDMLARVNSSDRAILANAIDGDLAGDTSSDREGEDDASPAEGGTLDDIESMLAQITDLQGQRETLTARERELSMERLHTAEPDSLVSIDAELSSVREELAGVSAEISRLNAEISQARNNMAVQAAADKAVAATAPPAPPQ